MPFGFGAQQILLGNHLQDGADVLCHAAVDEHQAVLQRFAGLRCHFVGAEDAMAGQQPPAADAVFRVIRAGEHARDQFDPRPDAARILPAAAGARQPLAEDGARGDQAAFVLGQLAGERGVCPVARMHAAIRQANRLVETASREPFGMPLTLLTSSMPRPGPANCASRSTSRCSEPSSPGGTSPAAMRAAFSSPR